MGRLVGASSLSWARVPRSAKSFASRPNISLARSGKVPDWVSDGLASAWRSAQVTLASVEEVKVEPPVTTHSRPRARMASM